ncbi:F-box only protein 34 [Chaetodon trifascialis]|uniref:F-box only protein 34 n=1 Tax=Chaetodon trifascialis TaxID=109706 RepID=UPI0039950AC4
MHLKSYPKLVRSELHLDAVGVQTLSQQSGLFVSQQGALRRTCNGNHGNISSSRLPLSVISTNTLRCSSTTSNSNVSSSAASLRLKSSPSAALQLLPPPPGYENDALSLCQTVAEDADAPLDIWTVIKPGHVREKIAIFASDGGRTDGAGDSERISTNGSSGRDRTPAVCTNHAAITGMLRAVKAKGSWEENSSAKRRRRSGSSQNLQQDQRTQVLNTQPHTHKQSLRRPDSTQRSADGQTRGEAGTAAEEGEQKVSVVEMVAFLEQRVSEQRPDSKPLLALQRSSTTITLSRAPPPEVREGEVRGEEPESIKVSDMVARLESECLRRRTEGDLSRSNSLRRTVGRVLLATVDHISTPCQPSSPSSVTPSSSSSLQGALSASREPIIRSETPSTESPASALTTPLPTPSGEAAVKGQEGGVGRGLETQTMPPQPEEAEPLPGLLFLSLPLVDPTPPPTDSEPHPLCCSAPPQPCPPSDSQSERKRRRRKADGVQEEEVAVVPVGRRASVSHDFLEMRQRLQQLLEPQPYLAVLPHHLLVKIFLLLPTQSLAALKCTCHYFRFVIDTYGVRPADSLWVSDPRYRDDPCKQCKKRYGRGDVSLCRWHHKPYCQALPYGPGYWMCCHGAHRDAPGCNVGLHDNRWVPAFHSINVPIYRRSREDERERAGH